jgi:hypothetical protein
MATTTVTLTANKYSNDQVRVLGIDEYKSAARTLADAFFKDDVAFYCLETPDNGGMTREELYPLHLEILEYIVAAHCYNGLVLGIGEHNEGIALWYDTHSLSINLPIRDSPQYSTLSLFLSEA